MIIDCDPGHDDALAIMAADVYADLLGITTVSGNVDLEQSTRNALIVCQVIGSQVAVHSGASRPLVAEPRHAEFIHGQSGLDGPAAPQLERSAASHDAVRFMIDTVRSRDDVWLVATGPLTNVALALSAAPDLSDRLQGIAIMGGGLTFGNVTPTAEFNILSDPEAARIVFDSGVRRVLAPLDLTHQFSVDASAIGRMRTIGTAKADFAADLLDFYCNSYARAFSGRAEGPLHDPCAVLALTHPQLFERAHLHVTVELQGEHTRGMTVADRRGVVGAATANTEVLTRIAANEALEVLMKTL